MIVQDFVNLQLVLIMFRLFATISAIATLSAYSSPQRFDWAKENGADETLKTIDPLDIPSNAVITGTTIDYTASL